MSHQARKQRSHQIFSLSLLDTWLDYSSQSPRRVGVPRSWVLTAKRWADVTYSLSKLGPLNVRMIFESASPSAVHMEKVPSFEKRVEPQAKRALVLDQLCWWSWALEGYISKNKPLFCQVTKMLVIKELSHPLWLITKWNKEVQTWGGPLACGHPSGTT